MIIGTNPSNNPNRKGKDGKKRINENGGKLPGHKTIRKDDGTGSGKGKK